MPHRLLSQARIWRSLYALTATGISPEGFSLTLADCTRRALSLFDEMLRCVDAVEDTACRLELLTSACALLRDTTLVADLRREDRWYARAEEMIGQGLREARAGSPVCVPLGLCLADYFYQSAAPDEDSWCGFLRDMLDAWAASFCPDTGWTDTGLSGIMDRTLLLNRVSYMFLDASRDAVIRAAYACCVRRMRSVSRPSTDLWERWYALHTEGNACPTDASEARLAVDRLARLSAFFPPDSDEWLLGRSYRLAWACWQQSVLSEVE